MLKQTEDSIQNVLGWKLDNRVKDAVQDSCLYKFASSLTGINIQMNFVGQFLEKYNQRKKAFLIGDRCLGLGLDDVYMLTGLPLYGKPVVGGSMDDPHGLCTRWLGKEPKKQKRGNIKSDSFCVKAKWLRKEFEYVPVDVVNIDVYIRAYYLNIIGSIICPGGSRFGVPLDFLYMLKCTDTDTINGFAWGSAVWAHTQWALQKKNGPTFCASSLLIQLFAMEHLPEMTKSLLGDDFQLPSRVPLAAEWTKLMKRFSHNTKSAELKLKNKFKVEHTPYKRLQDNKFKRSHPETWNNLELCAGTFSCICLHRNEHYDYQRYNVQLGLPFMEVPDERDIIRKSRKGVAAYFNFEDKYAADIKAWEEKEKTFISEIPYISSFKCSDDQQDEGAQNSPTGTSTSSFPDEPTLPFILPTTAHSSPHTPINHEDGLYGGNNRFLNDNFNVGGGEYDFQGDLVYIDDLQDDTRLEEMTQKPVVKRKRKRVNKSKKKRKVGKIYPVANRYTIDDTHDVERKVNSSLDKTELHAKWVLDRRGTIWIS